MEAWGQIKANGRGIVTAMEPFHFDPPDFDPTNGWAWEERDDFTEEKSNSNAEIKLEKKFETWWGAGGSDPDARGAQGGG